MDRFLLGRLADGPRPSPEVGWAWARLMATGGAVPIGRLAGEVGWSHKQLIARFRQQIGLRPKTAARTLPPMGSRAAGQFRSRHGRRRSLAWPTAGSRSAGEGERYLGLDVLARSRPPAGAGTPATRWLLALVPGRADDGAASSGSRSPTPARQAAAARP
jgi:hypothetical protein